MNLSFSVVALFALIFVYSVDSIGITIENEGKIGKGGKGGKRGGSRYDGSSSDSHEYYGGKRRGDRKKPRRPTPKPPTTFTCESGWTKFERKSGPRCIRVFGGQVRTSALAEMNCQNIGAVLSGIENKAEADWMAAQGLQYFSLVNFGTAYRVLWVGGARKPECYPPYATSCFPAQTNMYYWTDPSVTGTAGMRWYVGQPDNGRGTIAQNCMHLAVQPTNIPSGPMSVLPGLVDDIQCNGYEFLVGYVCSKPATRQR